MEKVRSEIQDLLRLVGPLIGRNDFSKLAAYVQQLEIGISPKSQSSRTAQVCNLDKPMGSKWSNVRTDGGYQSRYGNVDWQSCSSSQNQFNEECENCGQIIEDDQHECGPCEEFLEPGWYDQQSNWENTGFDADCEQSVSSQEFHELKDLVENLAVQMHELKMRMEDNFATASHGGHHQNIMVMRQMSNPELLRSTSKSGTTTEGQPKCIPHWE